MPNLFYQVALHASLAFKQQKQACWEKHTGTYLRETAKNKSHQPPDVWKRRVTVGVTDVSAAGVQNRPCRQSAECGIITHVEQDSVQVFSQFHWLKHTRRCRVI